MRVKTIANRGGFQLEGVSELKAALAELSNEVATKEGRRANRAAAKVVFDAVYSYAPHRPGVQKKYYKGSGRDYGDLRDNIKIRLAKARKDNVITYNITTGNAFWAGFLEFGTVNMTARPWMRPAFDASVRSGADVQITELRKGVERAAKKANRLSRNVASNGRNL